MKLYRDDQQVWTYDENSSWGDMFIFQKDTSAHYFVVRGVDTYEVGERIITNTLEDGKTVEYKVLAGPFDSLNEAEAAYVMLLEV